MGMCGTIYFSTVANQKSQQNNRIAVCDHNSSHNIAIILLHPSGLLRTLSLFSPGVGGSRYFWAGVRCCPVSHVHFCTEWNASEAEKELSGQTNVTD